MYDNNHYVQSSFVKQFGDANNKTYILQNNIIIFTGITKYLCAGNNIYPKDIETHPKLVEIENNFSKNKNKLYNKLIKNETCNISYFIDYLIINNIRNVENNDVLNINFEKLNGKEIADFIIGIKTDYNKHKDEFRFIKNHNLLNIINYKNIDYINLGTREGRRKHKKLFKYLSDFYNIDIFFNNKSQIRTHPLRTFLDGGRKLQTSYIKRNNIKYFFYSNSDNFIMPQPPTIIIDNNLHKSGAGILNTNIFGTISPNILIGIFKKDNDLLNYNFKNKITKDKDNNYIIQVINNNEFDFLNNILFQESSKQFTICKYDSELEKLIIK